MPNKAQKILLVDDEPDILSMVTMRLRANGYDVATAENGKKAIEKMEKDTPDIIILDVMMPVMDGFQFFKEIKKDKEKADIPILVLTARGAMKDTFEALDAEAFVPKPFDADDLMSKIRNLLQKKVLVLSSDNIVNEKVTSSLESKGYVPEIVADENTLVRKGKEEKFHALITHLAMVKKDPKDLVAEIKTFKKNNTPLVLYCDATVPGVEENDTVAIEDIRIKWKKAGADNFYDPRMTKEPFGDFFSRAVEHRRPERMF